VAIRITDPGPDNRDPNPDKTCLGGYMHCPSWADSQSVQGFRCYDNIHVCKLIDLHTANAYSTEREMSASACTRSIAGCIVLISQSLITFRVSTAEAKCVLAMAVCLSVCMAVPRRIPTLLHGPECNLGEW